MQGGYLAGERYELHRATMLDLIREAYNVDAASVFGGPNWLDYDRFEVIAKTKPGTLPATLRLMLQALLAERFHLAVKPDTRQVPGFILSKGKGEPKLKVAGTGPFADCPARVSMDDAGPKAVIFECRHVTMDDFAQTIRPRISQGLGRLPLLNSTGLEGAWDFDLEVPVRTRLIDALPSLGLKIANGDVPQPVLSEEQPSANPPGVAESLPPPPAPVFEVASLKPCNDDHTSGPHFETGGRVTATCMPLSGLIRTAWNLPPGTEPVGVTDAMRGQSLSLVAKAPPGVATDPQHNTAARDVLNAMMRALLTERFQMKVHYEDRPMDAYTLVAGKPKLAKAVPAGRTGCAMESRQQEGRALLVRWGCHNITMAQFAEQLDDVDLQFRYPVEDATGLEGAFDFTLDFDANASMYGRIPLFAGRGADPDGQVPEPPGTLTIIDAIGKQLGLKLEIRKRLEPVLVIDHIAERPVEN
jgi:uncharacterized protein (TIGR03435 family)